MKISIKALLLSAFVFPGAGHFVLKRYVTAAILAAASAAGCVVIMKVVMEVAQALRTKLINGEIPLDVTIILESVRAQIEITGGQTVDIVYALVIICWVIGISDSYRIGYKQDRLTNSTQ